MTKKNKVVISLGAMSGLVILLILGYIALIIYVNWPASPVAENIAVGPEWVEIAIEPGLGAKHRSQTLNLRIENFAIDSNQKISEIRLVDGTVITPEIEIYDDEGQKLTTRHIGFGRKHFDAVVFRPDGDLNADKRYPKIRIRSAVPFMCEGIHWIDYNPK